MRITRSFALIGVLVSTAGLFAQALPKPTAPDPQKTELVRKIFAADGFDKLARQMESQTYARTLTAMAQNPVFPRGFLPELSKRVQGRMTDLDLQAMLVPIYAERFTTEELRQILEFESSPVGQKLRSSEATMLAEIQPQMVAWSRSTGQEVTRQILTEHPEWANEIAERRQKQNAQALATMPAGDERANEAIHWNTRDVQPPQIISKSEPQYSEDGLKAKTEGSVGLSITVGVDGAARDIKVVRPLGQGLDEKAIEAVRTWHWKPAMKGGVAIATRATVEVNFRLLNTPPPQK